MTIQKLDYITSLLNKPQFSAKQGNKEISVPVESENRTNHKLRNWSIGLGAAATLISLGVAGRKGHLGQGIQKLLGGAEKNSSKLADDVADTASNHNNPQFTSRSVEISQSEINEINALLDKNMQNVVDNAIRIDLSQIPSGDTYEKLIFDTLRIPRTAEPYSEQVFKHNGSNVSATYRDNGNLFHVSFNDPDGKLLKVVFQQSNNKILYTWCKNGTSLYKGNNATDKNIFHNRLNLNYYNSDGELERIHLANLSGQPINYIDIVPESKQVKVNSSII